MDMKLDINGRQFSSYVGKKWFISKILIFFVSIFMVLNEFWPVNIVGYFLFGYLFAMVITSIRFFIMSNKMWEFQKEVIDWEKVKNISEE